MEYLEEIIHQLRTRRWLAVSVGGLMGAVLLLVWGIVPRAQSAYQSYRLWHQQQQRIQSAQEWKTQLQRLRSEQETLQRRLDSLFVSLPQGDRMSVVLEVLQESARQSDVELQQVRPQGRATFDTYEELPLEVVLSGQYHSIGRFVDRIEQSKYLMKIERLVLQSEEMTSDTLRGQIQLSLLTLRDQGALPTEAPS